MHDKAPIEDIAKRRGFFWQSSEIYGGLGGFYDYGHIGSMIKRKWENSWRNFFLDENCYEIEPANIMHEKVFVASNHINSFTDPMLKCEKCGTVERADQILEEELKKNFEGKTQEEIDSIIKQHSIKCRKCKGTLKNAGTMNMMFPVDIGVGDKTKAYLRPETAQGVFVNFRRIFEQMRKQLPLGIAIIGKAYRNEISPRNLLIRMREFNQAELQIFFDPQHIEKHDKFNEIANYKLRLFSVNDRKTEVSEIICKDAVKNLGLPQFYVYYLAKIQSFYLDILKIQREKFRFRELNEEERAFYNKIHWDVEINMTSLGGWKEFAGCHYRADHDLSGHQKVSKQNMGVNIDGRTFVPHVIELSFGIDRNLYALLEMAIDVEKERTVLHFPRMLSPYDCAIFPLMSRDNLPETAKKIVKILKEENMDIFYDESGSIGRRYRRMDEIGVACCITVDHQTIQDNTVTLRDRDSMEQVRVEITDIKSEIKSFLEGKNFRAAK